MPEAESIKTLTVETLQSEDTDIRLLAEVVTLEDFEVMRTGTWNGDPYTEADLREMVEALDHVGFTPPAKLGHAEDQKILQADGLPAAGWVSKLKVKGTRLLATLKDVPRKVAELIKLGAYRHVSAEVFWNLKHEGKVYRRALKAVALLGADVPAVKGLKPLDAYLSLYSSENEPEGDVHVAGVQLFTENPQAGGEGSMPDPQKKTDPPALADNTELKKMAEELARLKARDEARETELKTLQDRLSTTEIKGRAEEVAFFIERAKAAGKLPPAEVPSTRAFLTKLIEVDDCKVVKYTDDEGKEHESEDLVKMFKDSILNRSSAFTVTSGDRKSPEEKKGERVSEYAAGDGQIVKFDEAAAEKAQEKALEANKSPEEAYEAYREAGLKGGAS